MLTTTEKKKTVNTATTQLMFVAATLPVLARKMGLKLDDEGEKLTFEPRPRPWLVPDERNKDLLCFDSDIFAEQLGKCSSGERHAMIFLLNVWNPGYAKTNGWKFELFDAVGTLDSCNLEAIGQWMLNPVWP